MGNIFGGLLDALHLDDHDASSNGVGKDKEHTGISKDKEHTNLGNASKSKNKSISGNTVSGNNLGGHNGMPSSVSSNLGAHIDTQVPVSACSIDVVEGRDNGGSSGGSYVNGDTGQTATTTTNPNGYGHQIQTRPDGEHITISHGSGSRDDNNKVKPTLPVGYQLVTVSGVNKVKTPDGDMYSKTDLIKNANDYVFNKYFDDLDMSVSSLRTFTTSSGSFNLNVPTATLTAMEKTIPGITDAYTNARTDLSGFSRYLDSTMGNMNNAGSYLSDSEVRSGRAMLQATCDFAAERVDTSKNNDVKDMSSSNVGVGVSGFIKNFIEKNPMVTKDFVDENPMITKDITKDLSTTGILDEKTKDDIEKMLDDSPIYDI